MINGLVGEEGLPPSRRIMTAYSASEELVEEVTEKTARYGGAYYDVRRLTAVSGRMIGLKFQLKRN